jgi:hypothetical protein
MSLITWTNEQFGINVPVHDRQHRAIFDKLNKLHAAVAAGNRAAIGAEFDSLVDIVAKHFASEETNMTAKSASDTGPSPDNGAAKIFPAATASWIARLTPTPPTGDMAWAASPMQSSPALCQSGSRSTATVSKLMSSKLLSPAAWPAKNGAVFRSAAAATRCPAP